MEAQPEKLDCQRPLRVDYTENTKEDGMRSRLCSLVVVGLAVMAVGSAVGQDPDARTLLQTSLKAMGGENMRSIRYSASTGYVGQVGQNYSPANDWPTNTLTSYTRTIDYEGKSSKEDLTMKQGTGQGGPIGGGNAPVITNPFEGEQRRTSMVSGNYAWNMQGTTIVPAPADAEQRQLEIWLTPHGCLKAALAPGANPIAIERREQGNGWHEGHGGLQRSGPRPREGHVDRVSA